MSHTTTIKSVPIRDITALRQAVADLQAEGVRCELRENATPRMYYPRQSEELKNSDYVLHLPDSRYDVAFVKQPDGSYAPAFDDFAGSVKSQIGATCPMPNSPEGRHQASIGKLMQSYTKHATINTAVNQGYIVESSTTDEDGNIHLTLSV